MLEERSIRMSFLPGVQPCPSQRACPRGGQQLVLLLYFSWAHTPDLTFLARNKMGTPISITLLEISLQVSGRGFSWSLVLLALEKGAGAWSQEGGQGLRWGPTGHCCEWGLQHQQGTQEGLAMFGQWMLQVSRRGETSNPRPASCKGALLGGNSALATPESHESVSWWLPSVWGLSCAFSECTRPSL